MVESSTMEQVFLVVVAGLLAWTTGGRILMGLIAVTKEREGRRNVTTLFDQAAREMAKQTPEMEMDEFNYLLNSLQQKMSAGSHEALLHMLHAGIRDRIETGHPVESGRSTSTGRK